MDIWVLGLQGFSFQEKNMDYVYLDTWKIHQVNVNIKGTY